MVCPRCGRTVSETANFCGGCGLPKAEVERLIKLSQPQPVEKIDIAEIDSTIQQLEGDLTGINPVENYTTDADVNTNKVENDFVASEIQLEIQPEVQQNAYRYQAPEVQAEVQSEYSANAPKHPYYYADTRVEQPVELPKVPAEDKNSLTTVDFIWMMLISGIPVIGFFYLLYNAFIQKESTTKSAWAKATLIIAAFALLLSLVFSMGIIMTSFMLW